VIGDVVNTAQRLQAAAKPGQILINEDTSKKLESRFRIEKIGDLSLKNKAQPVTVFQVLG